MLHKATTLLEAGDSVVFMVCSFVEHETLLTHDIRSKFRRFAEERFYSDPLMLDRVQVQQVGEDGALDLIERNAGKSHVFVDEAYTGSGKLSQALSAWDAKRGTEWQTFLWVASDPEFLPMNRAFTETAALKKNFRYGHDILLRLSH